MAIDVTTEQEYQSLKDHAAKHSTWETFRDAMLVLAEHVWHQARTDGNIAEPDQPVDGDDDSGPEVTSNGQEVPDPEPVTPVAPVQSETQVSPGS